MTSDLKLPPKPIKGRGLTVPGVFILQTLLIFAAESFEYSYTKVGIFTGIALLISFFGGLYLGRAGTSFVSVVNPPLVFMFATLVLMATVGGTGLHLTKIGVDLISAMSGAAPYLVLGTFLGWIIHFFKARRERKTI